MLFEVSLAVVQEDDVYQGRVKTLGQYHIEIAVAVEIAKARIGGGFCTYH